MNTDNARNLSAVFVGVLAVSTSTHASFILGQSTGQVGAEAIAAAVVVPTFVPDPDPDLIPWNSGTISDADITSSASASQFTSASHLSPKWITGIGFTNASAIGSETIDGGAAALSFYDLVFTVDSSFSLRIDWELFASKAGIDSNFELRWAFQENHIELGGVSINGSDVPSQWAQGGIDEFPVHPGNTYAFNLVALSVALAGENSSSDFAASAARWEFELQLPAPSTFTLLAPAGMMVSRRRN